MAISQVYYKSLWNTAGVLPRPIAIHYMSNDFESCLKFSKANLYADDTEVSFSVNNPCGMMQKFQAELKNISEWMRMNKLSRHPEKNCVYGH